MRSIFPQILMAYALLLCGFIYQENKMGAIGKTITTKCCYCGMVKSDDRWHFQMDAGEHLYSHGCCPVCEAQMMSELEFFAAPSTLPAVSEMASLRSTRRPVRATVADAVI